MKVEVILISRLSLNAIFAFALYQMSKIKIENKTLIAKMWTSKVNVVDVEGHDE